MAKSYQLTEESITSLQIILEDEYQRPFTREEAEEVGRWLMGFYAKLAQNKLGIGRTDEPQPDTIRKPKA